MKVVLGILLVVVFLASAVSLVGGALMKYTLTEGVVGGVDTQAAGTLLLLAGILGFLLFLGLLAISLLSRRRERRSRQ